MKKIIIGFCFIVLITAPAFQNGVSAASLFDLHVTSEGQTFHRTFEKVENLIDGIDEDEIRSFIPGYTDNSAAHVELNFRGLPIYLSSTANSTELVLSIPSIDVQESFIGATRDGSADLLEDWFEKEGGDSLTRLMKKLAETTANDPIAGNPNSLMSTMAVSNFDRGFTTTTSEIKSQAQAAGETNSNLLGVGLRFGYLNQGNLDSRSYSLPLSYTVRFSDNARRQLKFSFPITVVDTDGGKSYNLALGGGYTHPVNKNWALTPAVDYGFVGSIDLGSVGQIISGSLTSAYTIDMGKYNIHIGNMIGHYKTLTFSYDDYDFDPDISNTILRNGVMAALPTGKYMKNTLVEVFATDTRFFGTDLYIDQFNEIGFSFGFKKVERKTVKDKIKNVLRDVRAGATYVFSSDSKGFTLNFGYTF